MTDHTHPHDADSEMARCIDACHDCHWICLATVNHCLALGGRHAGREHVKTMLDCAEICATSAGFMSRGSEMHAAVCGVCAEICRRCAESCERMGDDAQMQRCAEACRRCAEMCAHMATHDAAAHA